MSQSIRILVIEDSQDDTDLLINTIRRGGYEPAYKRIETPEDMQQSLDEETWDMIISDYSMPHFSGVDALQLLHENELDIPFIIISGVIGEEMAVQAMRAGAQDYLMKGSLARLIPVIERELREAQIRQAQREARAELERLMEEREQHSLEQISNPPQTAVTAQTYGSASLRKIARSQFDSLSRRYSDLLDMALEQNRYKVSYSLSDELRDMAKEMGVMRASPRDIVEIHNLTLRNKRLQVNKVKADAYIEEGRLMLLELMGYLVSYYRNYVFGVPQDIDE